jgi:hypothetical protein
MKLKDPDLMDFFKWFEDALTRAPRVDKRQKMRMRRKIRDEIYLLLTWEKPTPSGIMSRWEERLADVFKVLNYGGKDDLLKLLIKKIGQQ